MLPGKQTIAQTRTHSRQGQEPSAALPVRKAAREQTHIGGSAWSMRCDGQSSHRTSGHSWTNRLTMSPEQGGQQPSSVPVEAAKTAEHRDHGEFRDMPDHSHLHRPCRWPAQR